MKEKPIVGQKMFALYIGGARRTEEVLEPVTVTRVGRKLFTVTFDGQSWSGECDFRLENFYQNSTQYSPEYRLYVSIRDRQDEKEDQANLDKIRDFFRYGGTTGLTRDQIRQIAEMVESAKTNAPNTQL